MNIKAITVAVDYSDLLEYTWRANKSELETLSVITNNSDHKTEQFCQDNNINVFKTNAFYKNGNPFNKAAALNEFFINRISAADDWILLFDADIILHHAISVIKDRFNKKTLDDLVIPNDSSIGNGIPVYFGKNKKSKIIYDNDPVLNEIHNCYDIDIKDCLISCSRNIYNTKIDYENGIYEKENCFFYGYFQLFHVSKILDKIQEGSKIFIENEDASVYDMVFSRTYWSFHEKKTLNLTVDHLGPIGFNWKGRSSDRW